MQNKKLIGYILLFVLLILSFVYYFSYKYNTYVHDDSFITYRYADNFASGKVLVYNEGEHIWGTTTVLYSVVLGLFKMVFASASIHIISQIISLLCFNLIFWYLNFKYSNNPLLIFLFYIALFINEYVNSTIFSGMETMFVILILVICISSFNKKYIYFLIPFLILARIDVAFVFIISLFIFRFYELFKSENQLKHFAIESIYLLFSIVIPFAITFLLFGGFIPNTIIAKSVIYKDSVYASGIFYRINLMKNFGYQYIVALPVWIFIVTRIAFLLKRKLSLNNYTLFFFVFSIVYFAFQVLFVTLTNHWYIPVLTFPLVLTVLLLFGDIKSKKYLKYIGASIFILSVLLIQIKDGYALFGDCKNTVYSNELYKVAKMIPEKSKIFCGDIGVIGYYNNSYIYDYSGLVTDRAIHFNKIKLDYGKGVTTDYKEIIRQLDIEKPDYANFREYLFYKNLSEDLHFRENYELIFKGETEILYKRIK